jgi:hypothetical protein
VCLYVSWRDGFDSRRYQIFWEVVGLERGPLSLVSTIEELLGRKSSGSGLENRDYGRRDPWRLPRGALYPQMLALTLPTSGSRSVGRVRLRTQATELLIPLQNIDIICFIQHPVRKIVHHVLTHSACIWKDSFSRNAAWGSVMVVALRTSGKVAGSRPDEVEFLKLPNPSSRTRPWGLFSL